MKLTLRQRQILWAYIFLCVSLIFYAVIRWYPTFLAFNISVRDWNTFRGAGEWVGPANYLEIWADLFKERSPIRAAFANTLRYVIFGVPIQMVIGLAVAMMLDRIRYFSTFFRVAFFIPYVTSAVAVAFVWLWLYNWPEGLINEGLALFGIEPLRFTGHPDTALGSVTAVAIWQSLGFTVILFLAGLQQIPDMYYEAASIDGASGWRMFRHITLPLLNPVIVYLTVLQTVSFLRLFALVQNMSPQGTGGPLNSTTTVVLEVYKEGFNRSNMGYASALTVILFFIILAITILQLRFLSRRVEY